MLAKQATSSEDGQELTVAIFRDGDFFGEMALLDGQPRAASAEAICRTATLTLHRAAFLHTINACPPIAASVLELDRAALALWPVMLGITAVHIAADRWKVHFGERMPGPPIGPFMLDQVIHLVTLCAALSLALPAAQVWRLDASPAAHWGLYASAVNAAISGAARLRSLVAGVAVVT